MAWIAVFGMGLVLGALGGGGGILTVPILVGLFGMSATEATGSSLFVVGIASSIGAVQGLWKKQVEVRSALLIAIPSATGAFLARKFVVPGIPENVAGLPKDDILLAAFAALMVLVGIRMLRPPGTLARAEASIAKIAGIGFLIGLVSGVLGAGGGFLILPALTLLMGVELTRAIPTSLVVISIQSLVGFGGELSKPIQWSVLWLVAAVAVTGLILGLVVRDRAPKKALQLAFAILVFLVAGWMFLKIGLNHF